MKGLRRRRLRFLGLAIFLVASVIVSSYIKRMHEWSSSGVILRENTALTTYIKKNISSVDGSYLPTLPEIDVLENRLRKDMMGMYCRGVSYKFEDYHFQYVGYLRKGRRKIFVNAFPKQDALVAGSNWRYTPIITFDTGPQYFEMEFDPEYRLFTEVWYKGFDC